MKFVLFSPLRLVPSDWAKFSSSLYEIFRTPDITTALGKEWQVHSGIDYKYHAIQKTGKIVKSASHESVLREIVAAFRRIRRTRFAVSSLNKNTVVLLFETGEACVVGIHDANYPAPDIIDNIVEMRDGAAALVTTASKLLAKIAKKFDVSYEGGETITHTMLVSDENTQTFEDVAQCCFNSEGLELVFPQENRITTFIPGWSFSICLTKTSESLWDTIAIMTRAQCEWYEVRVAQDFCLRTLGKIDLEQPVKQLIQDERTLVQYQTEFRLWRHRFQEYRANLKPELTEHAKKIEDKWETQIAKNAVFETLIQTRDLIQTSYSRRLLIQERRQSAMIFALTALGFFSIASIAATYWNWLTLANFTANEDVATPLGRNIVVIGLISLVIGTGSLIIWFLRIRSRPD